MSFTEKMKKNKKILVVIVVTVFLMVGFFVFFYIYNNRCYENYTVKNQVERSDSNNVTYRYFNGNILKYSRSGISVIDNVGKSLWNGGYEMRQPQVDTCDNYVVVAEVGGKQLFVFDGTDEGTKLETSLPIVRAKVARQGVVAVLLQDRDSNVLNIYNPYAATDSLLIEIPTNVSEEGYPLDFDISPDGKSVVISYMQTIGSKIENKVNFYNFSEVGKEKNTLVGGKSFGENVIAKIEFVGDDTVVVFHEKGYTMFESMKQPEMTVEMTFDENIKSMAFGEGQIAVVTSKSGTVKDQMLALYDESGGEKLKRKLDYEYSDMQIYGNEIIFVGNRSCDILRMNGKDKFHHKFEKEIDAVFPTTGATEYTLIDSSMIQKISLEK